MSKEEKAWAPAHSFWRTPRLQQATGKQDQPGVITGLIVALDPQDAVTLKYFVDAGANVSLSLRPAKLTAIFDVVPETINYIADKFGIKAPELLP